MAVIIMNHQVLEVMIINCKVQKVNVVDHVYDSDTTNKNVPCFYSRARGLILHENVTLTVEKFPSRGRHQIQW